MRHWPETIRVALRHQLLCIGCPIASFHMIEDAVREHELDGASFRRDIYEAIEGNHGLRERPSASNIKR
ncbi:MAG: hypothetical protein QM744_03430 [Mesorhizobium sp.]